MSDSEDDLPPGVMVKRVSFLDFEDQQSAFPNGFYHLRPYNQVLPSNIVNYVKTIKDFECREDDVWVGSFPKCGRHLIM